MWDNSTPLQLLKSMPRVLEKEHLEKLQMLLEADKYKNQLVSGFDLCGMYAPFCLDCDKENKYPCAVAYINYLKAEGVDIEIASEKSVETNQTDAAESSEEQLFMPNVEKTESVVEVNQEEKPEKNKIRIAIARKKTLL